MAGPGILQVLPPSNMALSVTSLVKNALFM